MHAREYINPVQSNNFPTNHTLEVQNIPRQSKYIQNTPFPNPWLSSTLPPTKKEN